MCKFDALIATGLLPPQAPSIEPEELYLLISKLVRVRVGRIAAWGEDPEDIVHDIFVTVSHTLQDGALRNPERLAAYILATAYRQTCISFHRAVRARHMVDIADPDAMRECCVKPRDIVEESQRTQWIAIILEGLPEIDQTILKRFYLDETKWETIAADLNLTATQFRLRKHRALNKVRRMTASVA